MSAWEELNPPYKTIVIHPPWPYRDGASLCQRPGGRTHFLPYSTMSMTEIAGLPVADLAVCDAHLYFWTTERLLWRAPDVLATWGFVQSDLLIWCKAPGGSALGSAFTPAAEFVVFARGRWGDAIRTARLAAGISINDFQRAVRGSATGLAAMWQRSVRYPNEEDWARLENARHPLRARRAPQGHRPQLVRLAARPALGQAGCFRRLGGTRVAGTLPRALRPPAPARLGPLGLGLRGKRGGGELKALTVWQPWASLIALGVKTIETRSWPTAHSDLDERNADLALSRVGPLLFQVEGATGKAC